MSTGRVLWLTFCLLWAGFWLLFGWFFVPFLNLFLAAASVAAFWFPVGKPMVRHYPQNFPASGQGNYVPNGQPNYPQNYYPSYQVYPQVTERRPEQ